MPDNNNMGDHGHDHHDGHFDWRNRYIQNRVLLVTAQNPDSAYLRSISTNLVQLANSIQGGCLIDAASVQTNLITRTLSYVNALTNATLKDYFISQFNVLADLVNGPCNVDTQNQAMALVNKLRVDVVNAYYANTPVPQYYTYRVGLNYR